ncbi:MAG TPA: MerR family transcriptional regulator [Bacillales bacterium]|nr:MerR family transcriptional regulator [Bacillales bacterium]
MEYTVQKLARTAGVSARTLRYYDKIGLLKPARTNTSGYRIYGPKEVDLLQQILFYRELGVSLETIKSIISAPSFNREQALQDHRKQLLEKRTHVDHLIANVEQTIEAMKGGRKMTDQEKFAGFKERLIEDNEKKYGKEIREKYGNPTVEKANAKVRGMTQDDYENVTRLANEVGEALKKAMAEGDPAGEAAQRAADLHRQWLTYYWDRYSKEAHAGLAQMYVDDERFKKHYDEIKPGAAEFLRDAIYFYTGAAERG